ncbi:MAG: amidase [Sneathiellaceae bacterium]
MSELAFRSATDLAAAIRRKEVGAAELLEHYLARVERFDPALNAVVVRDFERARARAAAADAALARGEEWGPLHGVPMTVKEAFNVAGLPTTWGLPELKERPIQGNAATVDSLLGAGAVIFGKTNVPVLLSDLQSYNPVYGTTSNPWDPARAPGGSSGGSAAALAAGLTGLELGSDIGGSIRNPAHFCGVYGHKPTWGVLPQLGHELGPQLVPAEIGVVGPLARSAADLALAMELMVAANPLDAAGLRIDLPAPRTRSLREMKVAVWRDDPVMPIGTEVAARLEHVVQALRGTGAEVVEIERPPFDTAEAWQVYQFMLFAVMASMQPDEPYAGLVQMAAGLAPGDASDGALGLRGATSRFRDWAQHNERRNRLRAQWASFFADVDILLAPVCPTPAFPHQHEGEMATRMMQVDGQDRAYFRQVFWSGITGMANLPSTVFPAGPTPGGLPVGIQAIGPEYGDRMCIAFADLIGHVIGGFQAPPNYD